MEFLLPMVNEYFSLLKKMHLVDEVFTMEPYNRKTLYFDIIRFAFFLPAACAGIIFHFLPASVIYYLSHKVKDTQFRSSVKFVLCMIIFPIYYIIILALPIPLYTKILILLFMPVTGILSFDYTGAVKRRWYFWQYYKIQKSDISDYNNLAELRGKIIKMLEMII